MQDTKNAVSTNISIVRGKIGSIIALLFIASISQVSSDLYTPSLPAIASYFGTEIAESQLSIAMYMISLTLTQLLWGPLSDSFGRKRILGFGLLIGAIGTVMCALTPYLWGLLLGRFIQGIGNGAAAGLWRAIFRDMFTGEELARIASYFGSFLVFFLVSAPVVGGVLQMNFGWRANFIFLLLYAVLAVILLFSFVKETKTLKDSSHKKWRANYKTLLTSPIFMGCGACNFLTYGGIAAWVTAGSPLLIDQMGMTPVDFGLWSSLMGTATIAGALLNGYFVRRVGIPRMLSIGWGLIMCAGFLLNFFNFVCAPPHPIHVYGCTFLYCFGCQMIFANTYVTAFGPFGHMAGITSGLYGFIQMSGAATTSYLISLFGKGHLVLAFSYTLAGVGSWMIYRVFVHSKIKEKAVARKVDKLKKEQFLRIE